ncbi:type III secretion system chaperone [Pokkaliibacter sp. CJK22405]|uniref:type III secretion system chaperone n=1 Tax=Pokkaliibacter sp. CJK22405 TaxID=3384615 RepID=UPI003984CDCB
MNTTEINELLQSVGRRDGLPELTLDSNACAGIRFADGVSLHFEWHQEQQRLHLYSPLPELTSSASRSEALYQQALRINCLSPDATLAMHPEREELYLQQALPADLLSIERLDASIDLLTRRRKVLVEQLASASPATEASKPAPAQTRLGHSLGAQLR